MATSDVRSWLVLLRYIVFCGRQKFALMPLKVLSVEQTVQRSRISRPDDASVAVVVKKTADKRDRRIPDNGK